MNDRFILLGVQLLVAPLAKGHTFSPSYITLLSIPRNNIFSCCIPGTKSLNKDRSPGSEKFLLLNRISIT